MPEAILTQDIPQLGAKGALVDVSKGYLRNYLLPRGLARAATPALLVEARRVAEREEEARTAAQAQARETAETLAGTVLMIAQRAGDDGRLFGSVTNQDVADAIRDARGIEIDRRRIHLAEPIRTAGTHVVDVEIAEGVSASVKTMVVAER